MKLRLSLLSLLLLFFSANALSQDAPKKWAIDPVLSSSMFDPNNTYIPGQLPLIVDNYVHPNTQPRIVQTPYEMIVVSPSQRVLPRTNVSQTEVTITVHPLNPNLLFGSSNAISFSGSAFTFISEGVYVSTNGGVNWFGTDTIQSPPTTGNHGGDPAPCIDINGNFIMTHLGYTSAGMFGNGSTNSGVNWSSNYPIQTGSQDKNMGCSDDDPQSPYNGRSYVAWVQFSSGYPARISITSNSGVNWTVPVTPITPQSGYIVRGTDITVGPGGVVYACWGNGSTGNGVEDFLSFVKSTDGGLTWTGANNVVDMNGLLVFGTGFAPYGIRMNSFPRIAVDKTGGPRHGWIYIATSQRNLAPAGSDADIVLIRSSNGGANWMPTVRVNQDPLNNGKLQFFNAVAVDDSGGVNIIYFSNTNTASDSAQVIVARSMDGGNTFTEIQLSDHTFRPRAVTLSGIATGYAGDYIGITAKGNKVHGLWMSNHSGTHQAWHAAITLNGVPANNIACGPFLSLPPAVQVGTPVNVKGRLRNIGTANQTNIPVKFFVNNVEQTPALNLNLNSYQTDSVTKVWTPSVSGTYELKFVSALATDNNRNNDTVKATVSVFTGITSTGEVPKTFSLSQNFPNPFNPVTNISFGLPKNSFVKITLYDILGKELKVILNENKAAGTYTIDIDASEFVSGVYFYKIEAGDFTDVKKMMLVK